MFEIILVGVDGSSYGQRVVYYNEVIIKYE